MDQIARWITKTRTRQHQMDWVAPVSTLVHELQNRCDLERGQAGSIPVRLREPVGVRILGGMEYGWMYARDSTTISSTSLASRSLTCSASPSLTAWRSSLGADRGMPPQGEQVPGQARPPVQPASSSEITPLGSAASSRLSEVDRPRPGVRTPCKNPDLHSPFPPLRLCRMNGSTDEPVQVDRLAPAGWRRSIAYGRCSGIPPPSSPTPQALNLPVTPEVAGWSPVAPARTLRSTADPDRRWKDRARLQVGVIRGMRRRLPSGTVTFLFTDVEGSTRLLHELGAEGYAKALAEHRRVLRDAFAHHGGVEVDTQGDAFFVAFPEAAGAVAAAAQALDALRPGPIRVRIGIHTGTPHITEEGYVGADVHRAARIAAAGHGGQVLISATTASLLGVGGLRDLGEHRLKDFDEPVHLYQLGDERFPPLKTISNTNLPRPASSFVGREREVEEVGSLLRDGARLLTLTGPGGIGKTRLAIETAAELVPEFKAGVFWVGLASLRDPALVTGEIGRTLGAKTGLAEHIGDREMLLLLDNLEQVVEAAPELASLVERCPNLRLLVTSRERLRVRGERAYPVLPLADRDAAELFCSRAQTEADDSVRELCRALDNLPLALELAAAQASVLSPRQILDRLSRRLDLLKGGRDADPRQRTLRAAIEWSHELLDEEEQRLFARLAVFRGGCTLAAAEDVAEADLDVLQSLVDKSLVRRTEERFWMLETIRDFAGERLERSGEADALRRRHAVYFRDLAERMDALLRAGEPEEGPVSSLEAEIDNLRAALEAGLETGEIGLVREITASLPMYWLTRGLYSEARSWLDRALALDDAEDVTRRRLLSALGTVAYSQGDHALAVAASDEAASLAMRLAGVTERFQILKAQATAALRKGDLETAERLNEEALAVAMEVDNGVGASACRLNLAYVANKTGRHDRAEALLAENLPFVRSRGQTRCEAYTLAGMAETAVHQGRMEDAAEHALGGARRALLIGDKPLLAATLDLFAASAAARGDARRAATILAATEAAREAMGVRPDQDEAAVRARAFQALGERASVIEDAWPEGTGLDLESALEIAERA
ncbi:MAG TPA: adenylate/guanylate cyclase domain-containing protein [Actinomycetota bacterium]|nr:adenylate/guanylate cyclase domain-containing protein [Actinomycetota bacterium]